MQRRYLPARSAWTARSAEIHQHVVPIPAHFIQYLPPGPAGQGTVGLHVGLGLPGAAVRNVALLVGPHVAMLPVDATHVWLASSV
jgi:hypothetical protein